MLPANSATAQMPQQEYLRQQAEALKAQMVRAQVEQKADAGFAQDAYAAQQAYLRDTAEKSFRIGKPHTTRSHLVSGQAGSYQAPPAMPPVHVSPGAYSVPPQRVAQAAPVPRYAPPQPSAYPNAGYRATPQPYPPQPYPPRAPQPRTIDELPTLAELDEPGESISGPTNRVGLQDRLAGILAKPKHDPPAELPTPEFSATHRDQRMAPPAAPPKPVVHQPLFTPERRTPTVAQLPKKPRVNRIDEAAYERMAAAIAEREVDRVGAFEDQPPSTNDIAQVSLTEPIQQGNSFPEPAQPASAPTFYRPSNDNAPSLSKPRSTAADQVSLLSRSSQQGSGSKSFDIQDDDDSDSLIDRLRDQRDEELPRPDSGSDLDSLRGPEQANVDEEKEALERRLKELEQETERRETKRRQRDLEREEKSAIQRERSDLEGDFLSGSDDDSDIDSRPARLSCEEFRGGLLNRSIRDISLDMSPRASRIRDQYIAISRSWTDRLGNVIATGAMSDLRRGYVIIDGNGGRQKVPFAKLSDADLVAVAEYWQIPRLCSTGDTRLPQRNWVPQSFSWTASSLCHKPLYFENQQLERYGHTHGPILQPLHSTAHFFVSLATLPYATAIHPPTECRYALGYYRPGNCAPWLKDPIPFSLDGLRRQALITTPLAIIP